MAGSQAPPRAGACVLRPVRQLLPPPQDEPPPPHDELLLHELLLHELLELHDEPLSFDEPPPHA